MTITKVTVRDAMGQFDVEMESRGYSARTIYMYSAKLKRFTQMYEAHMHSARRLASVSSIDAVIVAKYIASYPSAYTRNDALQALRMFVNWAIRMKYIAAEDGLAAIDRRRAATIIRPHTYIRADQFVDALDMAEEYHPQGRIVAALGIFTLCRVSEISAITLKHVNLRDGELLTFRQKRHRWTTTVISPDLREELDYWLTWYAEETGCQNPQAMIREHPDWFLVPRVTKATHNNNGRFVPGDWHTWPERRAYRLELVVKHILAGLGIEGEQGFQRSHKGEGMHLFRRSAARALLLHLTGEVGEQRALLQVSKMLDHENTTTTLRYIGMDLEKAELDKYLRSNRMFGDLGRRRRRRGEATVVPIGARSVGTETTKDPSPYEGEGSEAQGV